RRAHPEGQPGVLIRLDPAGILAGLHATIIAAEIESGGRGILSENRGRVPGGGPLRLALIDPLVLIPELALLVGAGGGVSRHPGEGMLVQGKVTVAPPEPPGVDQPLLD